MSLRFNFAIEGHFLAGSAQLVDAEEFGSEHVAQRVRDRLAEVIGEELDGLSFDVAARVTVDADEVA